MYAKFFLHVPQVVVLAEVRKPTALQKHGKMVYSLLQVKASLRRLPGGFVRLEAAAENWNRAAAVNMVGEGDPTARTASFLQHVQSLMGR